MSWNPFEPVKIEPTKIEDDPYKVDRKAIEKRRKKREKQLERIAEYYEKTMAKGSADADDTPSLRRGAYTSLSTRYSSTNNQAAPDAGAAIGQKLKRF